MRAAKSVFWLCIATKALFAVAGSGSGDGAGSTKETAISTLASNSAVGTVPITPPPTITGTTSFEATQSAASSSGKGGDDAKGTATSSGDSGHPSDSAEAVKSGGEGTTPIDPVVVTPVFVLVGFAVVLFFAHVLLELSRADRLQKSAWEDAPRVVTKPSKMVTMWKRISYSALWGKRRSREFRPFGWLNIGALPTRLEFSLMMFYLVLNIVFAIATVDWSQEELSMKMDNLRNHTGTLATANLIPLVLTAGRNNPLIRILHIPFDTFNLMHRYLGRLVVLETLLHVTAVLITKVSSSGWSVVPQELWGKDLVLYGFISSIMFMAIIVQAWSPFRHAFYEFFLHCHIILSIGAFVTLWYHLETLQQQYLMIGVFLAWSIERAARVVIIIWQNAKGTSTKIEVGLLAANTVWMRIRTPHSWSIKAGQHIYLYIPSIGLWTSHPFSIAWADHEEIEKPSQRGLTGDIIETYSQCQGPMLYLVVKCHNGFTRTLRKKAAGTQTGTFSALAFAEGPYGGLEHLTSFRGVVLVAGGVGITHHLLHIRELIEGYRTRTAAIRRITLAWSIRTLDQIESVQGFLQTLLSQHAQCSRRNADLAFSILIFVSSAQLQISIPPSANHHGLSFSKIHRPQGSVFSTTSTTPIIGHHHDTSQIESQPIMESMDTTPLTSMHNAASVEVFHHRLNIHSLLNSEMAKEVGATYVSVCGPGGLADDVRDAVREQLREADTVLEFYEESFSW